MELTIKEKQTINELTDFGSETIRGIKMTGIEVAVYDMAVGAAALKIWDTARHAKAILTKLNPKAAQTFFGVETDEKPAGVYYPNGPAVSIKVGRNAPCPCGSGKKSKKCCH